jgi:hypothetical protein
LTTSQKSPQPPLQGGENELGLSQKRKIISETCND